MLVKEIERVGIPAVLITALPGVARAAQAQRIIQGKAVTTPTGDALLPPDAEKRWRRQLAQQALQVISAKV